MDGAAEIPRFLLEEKCIKCHHPQRTEGGLDLSTRESLLRGGDSGAAIDLKQPDLSRLLQRIALPANDDEVMPPKKHAAPLTKEQQQSIAKWIAAGAVWPEGLRLHPREAQSMLPWDAAVDASLTRIQAFPERIQLDHHDDFHRLVIVAQRNDGETLDITNEAKLTISHPAIARLTDQRVEPLSDGDAEVLIVYRGLETRVPVQVRNCQLVRPVSFQLDIIPQLTATGCNAGSCHGAASGKDGFHLSLYGFDPAGDYYRLLEQQPGRRVNLAIPEASLLLTKALGQVSHTGGKLFAPKSNAEQVLLQWIREGAKLDDEKTIPHPTSLSMEPREWLFIGEGKTMPLTVCAHYSDGTDRDVTELCAFSSTNDHSVRIEPRSGVSRSREPGEALLLARFQTLTQGAQVIVIPADSPAPSKGSGSSHPIDLAVQHKLSQLRIEASPRCDDASFLRRSCIDLIGRLPTQAEWQAFLSDNAVNKRDKWIDHLLDRPEFSEIWSMKWAELLQIRTFDNGAQQVSYKAALGYYQWLQQRIAANRPLNEIFRELLSSEGGTFDVPATNFFQIEQDVLKLTENIVQVFTGMRVQCAQCHNHPFDRWSMNDYYGFASFFAQVKRKNAEDPRERIVFDADGEVPHLVTKKPVPPTFLGGDPAEIKPGQTRRQVVAEWLTNQNNPWFARHLANVTWAHFFGIGIVEPVDDVRISNPPANAELLDVITQQFIRDQFDLKKLVRFICQSETYQRSTSVNSSNRTNDRHFSHALTRRIRAEVLLDCISQITATPNKFRGLPLGSRAVQIADGNTSNYFLTTFGRASRASVCSCEVKLEPNLSQALHLLNGETTHQRIQQGKVPEQLLKELGTPESVMNALYIRAFSRQPSESETQQMMNLWQQCTNDAERLQLLNDLFWAILNAKEFVFNH